MFFLEKLVQKKTTLQVVSFKFHPPSQQDLLQMCCCLKITCKFVSASIASEDSKLQHTGNS